MCMQGYILDMIMLSPMYITSRYILIYVYIYIYVCVSNPVARIHLSGLMEGSRIVREIHG